MDRSACVGDKLRTMIIAIDGPAGAGKSTIARRLGRELGLFFLDTGAMYRSVAAEALRRGVDTSDEAALVQVARGIDLRFDEEGEIFIDGRPGGQEIRASAVDGIVSVVAAVPAVRAALVPKQKLVAERQGGVVAEGRDMTTVVFPEADYRFFLDASAAERARRRVAQRGQPELEEEIRRSMEERDRIDSTRMDSPLRLAAGVQRVQTDELTVDEVVAHLLEVIRGGDRR
jgi:CMP/dCMP kinase